MKIPKWNQRRNGLKQMLGLFLCLTVLAGFARPILAVTDPREKRPIEEMSADEKQAMIKELLKEGDQYKKEKNYNLANASYESVFLLQPDHVGASQKIDRLKKELLKEGKSETDLVTHVYDEEIEMRTEQYLKDAKAFIAQGKMGQAKFALQKLLLINPLHAEANKLYERVNPKGKA